MSFILDALKKSEAERQRKGTPGIADVPQSATRSGSSRWAWIIGILLTVNLAVLGGLMLRSDPVPPLAQEPTSTDQPPRPEAAQPSERFAEIVADVKSRQPVSTVQSGEAVHTETPLPSADTVRANAAATRATVVDGLPSLNDLRANGTLQLADLHLDIHVYSTTPSDRFVFINMSRYKENATLAEGPEIREITPDGVILEHLGTRFLLPRE
jgi:general secretion pathway protein B